MAAVAAATVFSKPSTFSPIQNPKPSSIFHLSYLKLPSPLSSPNYPFKLISTVPDSPPPLHPQQRHPPGSGNRFHQDPLKGLFYCMIYLKPGDYHRIHSPVDWTVLGHFTGNLFPVNERATRTIGNLYVENERRNHNKLVVLEGRWQEGYMPVAAIGATNIGSIELFIEPTLRTNNPQKKLLHSEPPEEREYESKGMGVMLKKGDEVAAFNMGLTVALVFQAPVSKSYTGKNACSSEFRFRIKKDDRIRMGESLGRWHDDS